MKIQPPPFREKNFLSRAWRGFFSNIFTGVKRSSDMEALLSMSIDKRGGEIEKRLQEIEKILFGPTHRDGELEKQIDGIEFMSFLPQSRTMRIQHDITDASESHTITDPADAPATADALRDDLVANAIPDIESALDALGATLNEILDTLEG